jgi:hypothetical protein
MTIKLVEKDPTAVPSKLLPIVQKRFPEATMRSVGNVVYRTRGRLAKPKRSKAVKAGRKRKVPRTAPLLMESQEPIKPELTEVERLREQRADVRGYLSEQAFYMLKLALSLGDKP